MKNKTYSPYAVKTEEIIKFRGIANADNEQMTPPEYVEDIDNLVSFRMREMVLREGQADKVEYGGAVHSGLKTISQIIVSAGTSVFTDAIRDNLERIEPIDFEPVIIIPEDPDITDVLPSSRVLFLQLNSSSATSLDFDTTDSVGVTYVKPGTEASFVEYASLPVIYNGRGSSEFMYAWASAVKSYTPTKDITYFQPTPYPPGSPSTGGGVIGIDCRYCRTLQELYTDAVTTYVNAVAGITTLTIFNASGSRVATIDVTGCTALDQLYAEENSLLTTINATGCAALTELYAHDCSALSSITLTGCTAAIEIYAYNDPLLTTLDLTPCTNIVYGAFYDNGITVLNIGGLTAGGFWDFGGNSGLSSVIATGFVGSNTEYISFASCNFTTDDAYILMSQFSAISTGKIIFQGNPLCTGTEENPIKDGTTYTALQLYALAASKGYTLYV